MTITHEELTQRAQALCEGSISLNEFKAWFTYMTGVAPEQQATSPPAISGEQLAHAIAAAPPAPEANADPKPHKDKATEIRAALQLSGFKNVQIERTDYGFGYDIKAEYEGKKVRRTVTRPELHLVVDLLRDEADG